MSNRRIGSPLKGKPVRNSLLVFSLVVTFLVLLTGRAGTAHATAPSTILKFSYDGAGPVVASTVHRHLAQSPDRVPGVLYCISVPLAVVNDRFEHVQITVGAQNNCPVDVTNSLWEFTSTLICGNLSIPGPNAEGTAGTLRKGGLYTVANRGFNIYCIVNSLPSVWKIEVNATVDGDIVYGTYDLAAGSNFRAIEGF